VSKLISHGQLLRCQAEAVARDRELAAAAAAAAELAAAAAEAERALARASYLQARAAQEAAGRWPTPETDTDLTAASSHTTPASCLFRGHASLLM